MSKIFERCLFKQISAFFEDILSKYRCGVRKKHSAQHCLLALIEKWKQSVDHGKAFGALLTNLPKNVDCFPHYLFIAKLILIITHLNWKMNIFNIASNGPKLALHKKWCFTLAISSVNVTKSAVPCGFGHMYWRNP